MYASETIRLKPVALPAYFAITIAIIFSLVSLTITHDRSAMVAAMIMGATSVIVWIIIRNIEITIDAEGIRYRNLFTKKTVRWSEVVRSYLKFHRRGRASAYYWYFVTTDQRTVRFSVRFFRRKTLRVLAQEVIANGRGAEIDPQISNMAEGVFPWRIFW